MAGLAPAAYLPTLLTAAVDKVVPAAETVVVGHELVHV